MHRTRNFELVLSEGKHEVAYLKLPTHPTGEWRTSRSLRLFDLMGKYEGPDVVLDFDEEGVLVGIEVVT
jgi:hypothetical protein